MSLETFIRETSMQSDFVAGKFRNLLSDTNYTNYRLYFYTCLSVILFIGGCLPYGSREGVYTPKADTLWAEAPPQANTSPRQTSTLGRHPPQADPPPRWPLQ